MSLFGTCCSALLSQPGGTVMHESWLTPFAIPCRQQQQHLRAALVGKKGARTRMAPLGMALARLSKTQLLCNLNKPASDTSSRWAPRLV